MSVINSIVSFKYGENNITGLFLGINSKGYAEIDDKERKELKEIMFEALKEYYEGEKTHPAWTLDQFQE